MELSGRKDIAGQVLYGVCVIAELLVHRLQLCRAGTPDPSAVSFDTVDRWCPSRRTCASAINAIRVDTKYVVDDGAILMAMDHLVMGNERLRKIFTASDADQSNVRGFV